MNDTEMLDWLDEDETRVQETLEFIVTDRIPVRDAIRKAKWIEDKVKEIQGRS